MPDVSAKRLELLKQIAPRVMHVAALWSTGYDQGGRMLSETEAAGRILAVKVDSAEVRNAEELQLTLSTAIQRGADSLIVLSSPILGRDRKGVVEFAAKYRLPAMYPWRFAVQEGGLVSYGAREYDVYYRAAYFVDKILRGEKPGDLPVEQPTKFELAINKKTAKALRLSIPPSLLLRAAQVIE